MPFLASRRQAASGGAAVLALIALGIAVDAAAGRDGATASSVPIITSEATMTNHPYVGMWVTDDGHIRQELLANGRYDEARGSRESAYRGRYEVRGNHIDYWDDTGFSADGIFVDRDTLHHGGMVFRRR